MFKEIHGKKWSSSIRVDTRTPPTIIVLTDEFVIGILWLDKGYLWIYLTCCGVLIDLFFFSSLFLPYPLYFNIDCVFFFRGKRTFLDDFCVINREICDKIYRLTSHLVWGVLWNLFFCQMRRFYEGGAYWIFFSNAVHTPRRCLSCTIS